MDTLGRPLCPRRLRVSIALFAALAALAATAVSAGAASRIVYAHDARLYFVSPKGTPLARTRVAGYFAVDIAASENGRRVAVLQRTGTDGAHGDFYRLYVRTAGERRLAEIAVGGPIESAGAPSLALSPDGRLLAISIGEDIRLIDLETKRRRELRKSPDGFDIQPSFTADGRHLVFAHGTYPQPSATEIYEIGLHGGHARRLTHGGRDKLFPVLSPDGRHLAYLQRAHRGFDLIVSRPDGSRGHLIHRVKELFSRPDFSPNGRRLTYGDVRGYMYGAGLSRWSVYTVGVAGGRPRKVVRGIVGGPLYPQWTRTPRR